MYLKGCHHSSVDSSAPSILPPRVRVPSTPSMLFQFQTVYLSIEFECEKNENKQVKRPGLAHFKKNKYVPCNSFKLSSRAFFDCEKCIPNKTQPSSNFSPTNTKYHSHIVDVELGSRTCSWTMVGYEGSTELCRSIHLNIISVLPSWLLAYKVLTSKMSF